MRTTRLAFGLALFFFASWSNAGTDTSATVTVQTTVSGNCKLVAYPSIVAFGTYDPIGVNASTPLDATYTIQISCVGNSPVRLDIDYGLNPINTTQRQLKSGAGDVLAYNIYKPTGAQNNQCFQTPLSVWGTGSTNGFTPASLPPNIATTQTYTVCARIASGLDPAVGSYTDTVNLTVFF